MIIVEYRLPLPLTLDEYNKALRYVIARISLQDPTHGPNEGIETLQNLTLPSTLSPTPTSAPQKPPTGIHTKKILRFGSRLHPLLRRFLPSSATELIETSIYEYPRIRTQYTNRFLGERLKLCIESNHCVGVGDVENAVGLPGEELEVREVVWLDIGGEGFVMEEGWFKDEEGEEGGRMCCYKVVKIEFTGFGLRRFVQRWVTRGLLPGVLVDLHRKVVEWKEEWVGLSGEELERMEREVIEGGKKKWEGFGGLKGKEGKEGDGGGSSGISSSESGKEDEEEDIEGLFKGLTLGLGGGMNGVCADEKIMVKVDEDGEVNEGGAEEKVMVKVGDDDEANGVHGDGKVVVKVDEDGEANGVHGDGKVKVRVDEDGETNGVCEWEGYREGG